MLKVTAAATTITTNIHIRSTRPHQLVSHIAMQPLIVMTLLTIIVADNNYDMDFVRTVRLIHSKSRSQLLLLICMSSCYDQRVHVVQWLRTHFNSTDENSIHFHYHFARQNFSYFGLENVSRNEFPVVLYIVAGREFRFDHKLQNETIFVDWLRSMSTRVATRIDHSWTELDDLLDQAAVVTSQCDHTHKWLMLIHNEHMCPFVFWNNIAKSLYDKRNISVVKMELDRLDMLDGAHTRVIIKHRLETIVDERQCAHILLLNNGAYRIYTGRVGDSQKIRSFAIDNRRCNQTNTNNQWHSIGASLTDIEMEYYSAELTIARSLVDKHIFIVIGMTGGIAVIVLAISIFWGLNGSSFA